MTDGESKGLACQDPTQEVYNREAIALLRMVAYTGIIPCHVILSRLLGGICPGATGAWGAPTRTGSTPPGAAALPSAVVAQLAGRQCA